MAETRYATEPSPCPVPPPVIAIQLASLDAVHEHSRATVTDTVPEPPDGEKLAVEFAMDTWQRVAVGPVTFVTAELPQPLRIDAAAIRRNSRDLSLVFTEDREYQAAVQRGISAILRKS